MWALNHRRVVFGIAASLCLLLSLLGSHSHALTTITEGYSYTKDRPVVGSIVSLENNTTDTVNDSTSDTVNNLLGVIVHGDSALLSVSSGGDKEVHVTTSGTVPVLVSDINGSIRRGDHITASPIAGVGMKATANVRIVGIAQGELKETKKQTVKNAEGKDQEVLIGMVPVLVNVAYFFQEPEKTIVPTAIQNVANALAGREVNTLPILISAGIFLVTVIIVVSIIYSMIRNSIISVGRNPMSQSSIYRNLVQMSALVIAILAVSVTIIYFVLKKL
jgi:hypothetical protein